MKELHPSDLTPPSTCPRCLMHGWRKHDDGFWACGNCSWTLKELPEGMTRRTTTQPTKRKRTP